MTKNEFMAKLDKYLEITKKVVRDESLITSISKEIDDNNKRLEALRCELAMGFTEQKPVEEPVPNAVPVLPAPVTETKKEGMRIWKNAIRVHVRNRITFEEHEFSSKNQASKFLGVSYPKLNDVISTDGIVGEWNVTIIGEPNASTPGA